MNNIQHHITFHDLSKSQVVQFSKYFLAELRKNDHGHIMYLENTNLDMVDHIKRFALNLQLSVNHLYMSTDFKTYGINHYREGKKVDYEFSIQDYYKLTDEILGVDFFNGLDPKTPEFLKAVGYFIDDYVNQVDSKRIDVKLVDGNSIFYQVDGSEFELIVSLNHNTGILLFQFGDDSIVSPDIRVDNGITILSDFLEDEYFDFIDKDGLHWIENKRKTEDEA